MAHCLCSRPLMSPSRETAGIKPIGKTITPEQTLFSVGGRVSRKKEYAPPLMQARLSCLTALQSSRLYRDTTNPVERVLHSMHCLLARVEWRFQ